MTQSDYDKWVNKTKKEAPKLTKKTYDYLMLPDAADVQTFSSTHLSFAKHGEDSEYVLQARKRLGYQSVSPHSKTDPFENVKNYKRKLENE